MNLDLETLEKAIKQAFVSYASSITPIEYSAIEKSVNNQAIDDFRGNKGRYPHDFQKQMFAIFDRAASLGDTPYKDMQMFTFDAAIAESDHGMLSINPRENFSTHEDPLSSLRVVEMINERLPDAFKRFDRDVKTSIVRQGAYVTYMFHESNNPDEKDDIGMVAHYMGVIEINDKETGEKHCVVASLGEMPVNYDRIEEFSTFPIITNNLYLIPNASKEMMHNIALGIDSLQSIEFLSSEFDYVDEENLQGFGDIFPNGDIAHEMIRMKSIHGGLSPKVAMQYYMGLADSDSVAMPKSVTKVTWHQKEDGLDYVDLEIEYGGKPIWVSASLSADPDSTGLSYLDLEPSSDPWDLKVGRPIDYHLDALGYKGSDLLAKISADITIKGLPCGVVYNSQLDRKPEPKPLLQWRA